MFPELHSTQVFSILILLGLGDEENMFQNQIIQVLTGEGKSIILGILATMLALIGFSVDVVCYSQHLSDRDREDFDDLFKKLQINDKIDYGTFDKISEKVINKDGDLRQLTLNMLLDKYEQKQKENFKKSILLIDEVDVFFSTDFYGQVYSPGLNFTSDEIKKIMKEIWQTTFNKTKDQKFFQNIRDSQNFKDLVKKYPSLEDFFKSQLRQMISSAQDVVDNKHTDYILQNDQIGYKELDKYSFNTSYGYLTTFSYMLEYQKGNIKNQAVIDKNLAIPLQCGDYSYEQIPKKQNYMRILGVTGTLQDLHLKSLNILKDFEINKKTLIPSMFGSTRLTADKNVFVLKNEDEQFLKIKTLTIEYTNQLRPVLIFFNDDKSLNRFYEQKLPVSKDKVIIIDQRLNKEALQIRIEQATKQKQITLLDKAFGRGTDFKYVDSDVNKAGGIVVIQTYLSEDYTEEKQIKGRTARQKYNGEFVLVLRDGDLQESFHLDQNTLDKQRSQNSQIEYQFLHEQRQKLWGDRLGLLQETVKKAQQLHDKTVKYKNLLFQRENRQLAIQQLKEFNIRELEQGICEGFHFIFAVDESGSMSSKDGGNLSRWDNAINAIKNFINERDVITEGEGQDLISVIYHGSSARIVTRFKQINEVLSVISNAKPTFGGNNFYTGVERIIEVIDLEKSECPKAQQLKKIILFLSDGGDCCGDKNKLPKSLNDLKSKYKDQISCWWNLGFGPGADQNIVNQMTQWMKECNGATKMALNPQELIKEFKSMASIKQAIKMK